MALVLSMVHGDEGRQQLVPLDFTPDRHLITQACRRCGVAGLTIRFGAA